MIYSLVLLVKSVSPVAMLNSYLTNFNLYSVLFQKNYTLGGYIFRNKELDGGPFFKCLGWQNALVHLLLKLKWYYHENHIYFQISLFVPEIFKFLKYAN